MDRAEAGSPLAMNAPRKLAASLAADGVGYSLREWETRKSEQSEEAAQSVGAAPRPDPAVRAISITDINEAWAQGLRDFRAAPGSSHADMQQWPCASNLGRPRPSSGPAQHADGETG
jgi:hypothetical protein